MRIDAVSPDDGEVRDLLTLHQRRMFEASPPGTSFALDINGLRRPEISLFAARDANRLLGVCALRQLSEVEGELKSMRRSDDARGYGVGQALLDHVILVCRQRRYHRLLLETGTGPNFEAANKLYALNGFTRCEAFGGYTASAFNTFYERAITA